MSTEQEQWAAQIREIPAVLRMALLRNNDAIRHRPTVGEWSALEVVGHMINKMQVWTSRVERLMVEEWPALPRYGQDALVRDHDYLHADPEVLFEQLRQASEGRVFSTARGAFSTAKEGDSTARAGSFPQRGRVFSTAEGVKSTACERFATLVEHIPISALRREGVHEEVGPMTLRRCIEAPLESAPEHLEQLRAAQTLV